MRYFHGTTMDKIQGIKKNGLKKGSFVGDLNQARSWADFQMDMRNEEPALITCDISKELVRVGKKGIERNFLVVTKTIKWRQCALRNDLL